MLGGGNPAHIPAMQDYFQTLLTEMVESGKAAGALCNYDGPCEKTALLNALAVLLRETLGWDIELQNIAGQMAVRARFSTYLIFLPDVAPILAVRKGTIRLRRNTRRDSGLENIYLLRFGAPEY
ncbi:hypothetical protein KCP78_18285 [Salmonella enterica subsp. enterica]|nr:hypothetical protein KCP78_18285 [Salmonella enterica subsp. enterica]